MGLLHAVCSSLSASQAAGPVMRASPSKVWVSHIRRHRLGTVQRPCGLCGLQAAQ